MIDKIKYTAKISSIGVFNFVGMSFFGAFSAAMTFTIGLMLLMYGSQMNAGHTSGEFVIIALAMMYPIQSIALLLTVISVYFIYAMSTSYAIKKVASKLVADKSESLLYPVIDKALDKTMGGYDEEAKSNMVQKGTDFALLQMKAIDNIKNESNNVWVRRLLVMGFEKLQIDDIPFGEEKGNIREAIKMKIVGFIQDFATPDRKKYWYILLYHWLVVLMIVITR
ncbi:MAG: hypothetical protein LBI72_10250 [Flavobacteriaceae bacterium]|jgi:predicted membrane protein|nr:hypothetical protein [Flavobacteriaceae bacterium]